MIEKDNNETNNYNKNISDETQRQILYINKLIYICYHWCYIFYFTM